MPRGFVVAGWEAMVGVSTGCRRGVVVWCGGVEGSADALEGFRVERKSTYLGTIPRVFTDRDSADYENEQAR